MNDRAQKHTSSPAVWLANDDVSITNNRSSSPSKFFFAEAGLIRSYFFIIIKYYE